MIPLSHVPAFAAQVVAVTLGTDPAAERSRAFTVASVCAAVALAIAATLVPAVLR